MLTFTIASLDDRETVERIFRASYTTLMAPSYDPEVLRVVLPKIVTAQDDLLASGTFLIGWEDATPVVVGGWTSWAPGTREETPGLSHIRHVAADPTQTGKGHGRALVERLKDDARQAGFQRMEALSTLNAEPFYARMGFRRIAEHVVTLGGGVRLPNIRMLADI